MIQRRLLKGASSFVTPRSVGSEAVIPYKTQRDTVQHQIQWTFSWSLSPWRLLVYPWTTIQTRELCSSALLSSHPCGSSNAMKACDVFLETPGKISHYVKLNSLFPNLLWTFEFHTLYSIWQRNGFWGLVPGISAHVASHVLKDVLNYSFLTLLHDPLNHYMTHVFKLVPHGKHQLTERSPKESHPTTSERLFHDAAHDQIICYTKQLSIQHPFHDFSQCLIKLGVHTLVYPLLCLKTRLILYPSQDSKGNIFSVVCCMEAMMARRRGKNARGSDTNPYRFFFLSEARDVALAFGSNRSLCKNLFSGFSYYITGKCLESMSEWVCESWCEKHNLTEKKKNQLHSIASSLLKSFISPLEPLLLTRQALSAQLPSSDLDSFSFHCLLTSQKCKAYSVNLLISLFIACWQGRYLETLRLHLIESINEE